MKKIKHTEIKDVRQKLLTRQNNVCALCKQNLTPEEAVLDHCHKGGYVRATLHRGCNALLGKIENNYNMNKISDIVDYLHKAADYIETHKTAQTNFIHPLFKTEKEKARDRKRKQVARRKAKKKEKTNEAK